MRKEIQLTFNRADIAQIYFGEGHGDLFFGPTIRRKTITLLIIAVLYPLVLLYTYKGSSKWLGVGMSLMLVIACYDFFRVLKQVTLWKRSVNLFLDKNDRYKTHLLFYDETSLGLRQDDEETIAAWDRMKLATINEQYISLNAEHTDFLLPRCSMSDGDYEDLIQMIKAKVPEVKSE